MTSHPSVSVVIPVYNGASTIGDTLTALQSQAAVPGDVEIIVVDNASTDNTADIVSAFPVRLLHESTRGPAAARNCGLHASEADIIAHLDADTLPSRRWLASIIAPLRTPETMLVAGKTLSFPPETAAERYLAQSQLFTARATVERDVLPFAPSLNMAVRREAAIAAGGWSEDMQTGEDVDFSTRVIRHSNCGIAYAPAAVLFHRHRNTDEALQRQAWTYGEGLELLYQRYPETVRWGAWQYLNMHKVLMGRALASGWHGLAARLRLGDEERAEYARYHHMWARAFWGGYMSAHRRAGRAA